jgi:phage recombination protein Bet
MTETALAIKEDFQISAAEVKKFICPTATDQELFMFMGIAKSYGLNPLKREIHFVKRKFKDSQGNWKESGSTIVGYEVYIKRAERTGRLDGWKVWIEKDDIGEKAIIEIKRKDQSMPLIWEVYRKEFDTEKSVWLKMPTFMLKKVAIAQGFRMAFPDDLGGMPYIPEEMPEDKGGGASESLSKDSVAVSYPLKNTRLPLPNVDGMGDELPAYDVPEPEIPNDSPGSEPLLMSNGALHKTIEALIVEYQVNRELFKNWLLSKGKIGLKDDRPSFSTMKLSEAQKMVEKWNAVNTSYQKWIVKQGGG